MRLKKIELNGFQNHISTTLKLHEGLNIIKGETDSGKSAIIRALQWVFFNTPLGDAFINEKTGDCQVIVTFEEGLKVERYKSKTDNYYSLQKRKNGSIKVFRAFGRNVPEEIQKAVNMKDINIQKQIEMPFFIGEKASQRGKLINNILHMEESQTSIKKINSFIREDKLLLKKADNEIKNLIKERDDLKWVDEVAPQIETIMFLSQAVQREKAKALDVKKKIKAHSVIMKGITNSRKKIKKLKGKIGDIDFHIDDLYDMIEERKKDDKKIREIGKLLSGIKSMKRKIPKTIKLLDKKKELLKQKMEKCPTCGQYMP